MPNYAASNEADHSPPSTAKAEEAWSHPSILTHAIM